MRNSGTSDLPGAIWLVFEVQLLVTSPELGAAARS